MSFNFIPLGIPLSGSYAISASFAITSSNVPATASQAIFALSPIGPTGPSYVIVTGSLL